MAQAWSRPATGNSDSVDSAEATGPVRRARAASATALRYCGAPNLPASPRPTTSTRGALTPGRSRAIAVRPARPLASPRATRAASLPPLASSRVRPEGDSEPSSNTPTMTQSTSAAVAGSRFSVNSRLIDQFPIARAKNDNSKATAAPTQCQSEPMPTLDRYVFREFAQSTFAALVVLGMV